MSLGPRKRVHTHKLSMPSCEVRVVMNSHACDNFCSPANSILKSGTKCPTLLIVLSDEVFSIILEQLLQVTKSSPCLKFLNFQVPGSPQILQMPCDLILQMALSFFRVKSSKGGSNLGRRMRERGPGISRPLILSRTSHLRRGGLVAPLPILGSVP